MNDVAEEIISLETIKSQFPLLLGQNNGKQQPLVYLDSGATSQKPQMVIDALNHYYKYDNANVHRGVYALSMRATRAYETARYVTKEFINAAFDHEVIFTRGTTEAINLVASSYAKLALRGGDEILISAMEHHSNIVPWQLICEEVGAKLRVIPVLENGEIDLAVYKSFLTKKTKMVAIIHVSNVLGTINPIKEMVTLAHQQNIPVLVDGAQAVPHMAVDVQDLDCDFYTFSGHKMYAPTGIGVLYGKVKWLQQMPPYQSGGDMISRVSFDKTEFNVLPHKFEAGTPNIAGAIGLAAAIRFLHQVGLDKIAAYEHQLTQYATQQLAKIPGLRIIGEAKNKTAVISFVMEQAHPHDIATILDQQGIAVRAGHHCAMPLIERFQLPATLRVSLGIYNTHADVDYLVQGLHKVLEIFG